NERSDRTRSNELRDASWSAAVLCRFPTHRASESARGLAQSKTSRTSDDARPFRSVMPLFLRLWVSLRRCYFFNGLKAGLGFRSVPSQDRAHPEDTGGDRCGREGSRTD